MRENHVDERKAELLSKPLGELRIDPRLRRRLIRLGFRTFGDVVRSDVESLEGELGCDAVDSLVDLVESFESDPEELYGRLADPPDEKEVSKAKRTIAASGRQAIGASRISFDDERFRISRMDVCLPDEAFVAGLAEIEPAARKGVVSLADHPEEAILAECFAKLSLKLDSLRSGVVALFEHYGNKGVAIDAMCRHFPNSFLLFVAHFASEDFEGDALWDKMFELLGIESQFAQARFKNAFYQGLVERGFPVFSEDESATHFLSTAVFHGGLSKSIWTALWKNALLPFAKRHGGALPLNASKRMVSLLKSGSGEYRLGRVYAERVIEKALSAMLEPLMESALKVASDIVLSQACFDADSNGFEMFENHGLTDAAMLALQEVLKATRERRVRYLHFPSAELMLDPAAGVVHLHWDAQVFPTSFVGRSIEYYVNGSIRHTEEFVMSVGKCILRERDIPVCPNTRFDVELFLIGPDGKKEASMKQAFDRTRPSCFEFVLSSNGSFRLRKPNWKIRKKTTLAYLARPDFRVVPNSHMVQTEAYEANREWSGASIQIFETGPSGGGSMVNTKTGDVVASWQEGFRTEIDRSHVIGKAEGGYDLYGFAYDEKFGGNGALPEICIEVPRTVGVLDELKIRCTCDGRPVSVHRSVEEDYDGFIALESGRIVLSFPRTNGVSLFAKECHIRIDQIGAHASILNYKFAVAPIAHFGIESLFFEGGSIMATYGFDAETSLTVPDEFGDYEMMPKERYRFDAALADDRKGLDLTLGADAGRMKVDLFLAAIDIVVSKAFREVASKRMLRIFDIGMFDARIGISSSGRRHTRGCSVFIGLRPALYKKMPGTGSYSCDAFGHSDYFSFDRVEERKPVRISVAFGSRDDEGSSAVADIDIATLATGFGLGKVETCVHDGVFGLSVQNAAPCDLDIELRDGRGNILGGADMAKGGLFAPLPQEARYALDGKKTVIAKISEVSLFGDPNEDTAMTVEIQQ